MSLRIVLVEAFVFAYCLSSPALADPISDLGARINGRVGLYTEDRRSDDRVDIGFGQSLKIGCHGDTLAADVRVTDVQGVVSGSTATLVISYEGTYVRDGWTAPCVKASREEHHLAGKVQLTITQPLFKDLELSWGGQTDVGDVADVAHDSNVFGLTAVKNAVMSAF